MASPELPTLTDAQKQIVLANYATTELGALVPLVLPGAKPDGRSPMGKAIRLFLAGESLTVKAPERTTAEEVVLTEAHKEQIRRLHNTIDSSLELARIVLADPSIKPLSRAFRAVFAYRKECFPEGVKTVEVPVEDDEYTPPVTMQELCRVVNGFVTTGDSRNAYNSNNLKVSEERGLRALMGYLRVYGLKYAATSFKQQVDRDLFLSTFIRWTHTKPDLTEIEVDQMISAATETVNIAQMGREIETVKQYHQTIIDGEEVDANGKKRRFGQADVEQINGLRTKHDQSKGRLKQLMEALEQVRSKRIDAMKERNASILNLLDEWMKDEQKRADLIEMGIREKDDDMREIGRLRGLEDVTALISGQSEEEAAM